jgi:hypothetical protein
MLSVREHTELPVVLVLPPSDSSAESDSLSETEKKTYRIDQAHRGGPHWTTFDLGRNRLALPERQEEDRTKIAERLAGIAEGLDLAEPFGRIRDAIEEAQQAIK